MFPQLPALVLGVISCSGVITTTFWNQWSVSGPTSKGVLGPIWAWRSLFSECIQYQGGQSQCQGQNSMFLMSGYKLALRGMMISAIILTILACCGIMIGCECTKILDHKRSLKRKIMFMCGVAFLFSGIVTFTSVAWYTAIIYNDFFRVETQDNFIHWELGACVYLGYITSFLCLLTFFACICRPGPKEKSEKTKNYYYKPKLYDIKSSKDDEQIRNLLDHYKSHYSRSRSSGHRSSRKGRSKSSSEKRSSKRSKSGRRSGHKDHRSVSFSSHSDKSLSIHSADSCSTCDTYRYSAYV